MEIPLKKAPSPKICRRRKDDVEEEKLKEKNSVLEFHVLNDFVISSIEDSESVVSVQSNQTTIFELNVFPLSRHKKTEKIWNYCKQMSTRNEMRKWLALRGGRHEHLRDRKEEKEM